MHSGGRVGRPRMNGAKEAIKELWDYIQKDVDEFR